MGKDKSIELHSPSECKDDEDCEVGVQSFTRRFVGDREHAGASVLIKHGDSEQVFEPSGDEPVSLVLSLKTGEVKLLSPPPLVIISLEPSEKLKKCEGDCDNDAECQPGLKCFQRDGYTPVPGCSGLGTKELDYCFDEENSTLPGLKSIREGSWGQNLPSNQQLLDLCEGDCDMDSECKEGYVCFQRDDKTRVPGCSGTGRKKGDYCAEPVLSDLGVDPEQTKREPKTDREPLGQCQGECDVDEDCEGDLECFQRQDDTGLTPVPGCRGSGAHNWDYCYKPEVN